METPSRPNRMVRPHCAHAVMGRLFRATQHRTLASGNETAATVPAFARYFVRKNIHLSILLHADFALFHRKRDARLGQQRD